MPDEKTPPDQKRTLEDASQRSRAKTDIWPSGFERESTQGQADPGIIRESTKAGLGKSAKRDWTSIDVGGEAAASKAAQALAAQAAATKAAAAQAGAAQAAADLESTSVEPWHEHTPSAGPWREFTPSLGPVVPLETAESDRESQQVTSTYSTPQPSLDGKSPEPTVREPTAYSQHTPNDVKAIKEIAQARLEILAEIEKRIVGQKQVIDLLLIALFARGHCLFVGVPGLAKTLLISTLADLLNLRFSRIQFTPDLMPSDITGTDVLQENHTTGRRFFHFIKGPLFANLVLADEINRTPPKTQAALLQAMQERRVTAGGNTYDLEPPFLVFATQNPIEHEGTYPLPEAQLDRFMFQVDVNYPSAEEEVAIVKQETCDYQPSMKKVLSPEQILSLQQLVLRVPAADHVVRYAVRLCRATRPEEKDSPPLVREMLSWGAGPRASQFLILSAKAKAILAGRYAVRLEDITELAKPVLQHRLVRNFHAEAEKVSGAQIVERLVEIVKP